MSIYRNRSSGFTITELLVSVAIIGLLTAIAVPSFAKLQARSKKVKCMDNLRQLYGALSAYSQDNSMRWPQVPEESGRSEEQIAAVFVPTTEPYGASQDIWLCPSDRHSSMLLEQEEVEYAISYVPCLFDNRPNTPYRWNMPWLRERGNFHPGGGHQVFPDGSVVTSKTVIFGR